jgi:predicted nucleic acid-binding protein
MEFYFLMMVSINIISVWAMTSCIFRELSCNQHQSRWHCNIYIPDYTLSHLRRHIGWTPRSIQIRSPLHCIMSFHISNFLLDFSVSVIHKPKYSHNTHQFSNLIRKLVHSKFIVLRLKLTFKDVRGWRVSSSKLWIIDVRCPTTDNWRLEDNISTWHNKLLARVPTCTITVL